MHELFRLFCDRTDDLLISMSQAVDANPGREVHILFSVCVPERRAFSVVKDDVKPSVGLHDIF